MADIHLKPLHEQTIVITGASSGIGLATARLAAERGARVVLMARSTERLGEIAAELRGKGAQVAVSTGDVGSMEDVETTAQLATETFGGFDSWINNAGGSAFGRVHEIPADEQRRIMDTVYWGVANGSTVALAHLRGRGGAIINVGSVVSEVALPLQVPYSAAKHAVKGFTDGLRLELENDNVPVSVTLIKPGSVDTPFADHAPNHLEKEPQLPPPYAAPELVAAAILDAAETPTRERHVGPGASTMAFLYNALPGVSDRILGFIEERMQQTTEPAHREHGGLIRPSGGGDTRSGSHYALGPILGSSRPMLLVGLGLATMVVAIAGVTRMRVR